METKYEKTLKALDDKPKEVIIEKEVEKIVEVPVEVIKEVVVEREVPVEKIVEVEVQKEIEVIKEVERIVEKEVPGPERIVEIPGPERIVEVPGPEKIVEVEKTSTGDLKEAARLMAQSEFNKEDLSEEDIYNLLQKSSEEDARKKIGFWAMPLPTDTDKPQTNKRYLGKK